MNAEESLALYGARILPLATRAELRGQPHRAKAQSNRSLTTDAALALSLV